MRLLIFLLIWSAISATSAAQPFTVAPSPNPLEYRNLLRAVDGMAHNDVWAVGDGLDAPGAQNRQFILHWDGERWTDVPAPHHNGFGMHNLLGVAAGAPDVAWAVGVYGEGGGRAVPQVLQWDGQEWVPDVIPEIYSGSLTDVFALSTDDAWAVGELAEADVRPALALHWDGISWSQVSVPPVGDRTNVFEAVHASATGNVWAVGFSRFWPQSNFIPLVMRWDGAEWTQVPLPADLIGTLLDVVTFGPNDTWVSLDPMTEGLAARVLHWDGAAWTSYEFAAGSFAAVSRREIYAFSNEEVYQWDGASWSFYQTLAAGASSAFRGSAAILDDGSLWAVGRTVEGEGDEAIFRTLAVHGIAASYWALSGAEPEAHGRGNFLSAPHPNPTIGLATLSLALSEPQLVRTEVVDALGRRILLLHDGPLPVGEHLLTFDVSALPAGVYVVRTVGKAFMTARSIVVR